MTARGFLWVALVVVLVGILPAGAGAVEIREVKSPGGITAWLVEDRINPIISVEILFRGGAALDPDGKGGLANMVSGLLDEGAGDIDSQAFRRELEDKAITLKFEAGRDSFSGSLRTLTENADRAFELLALALTKPRFDAEPVERVRNQILTSLRHEAEDPDRLAADELNARVFAGHGYASNPDGTAESVNAITVADLRTFTATRLGRDNLVIGVVGDITPAKLAPMLDRVFGALPAKAAPWQMDDVRFTSGGGTVVIDKSFPQSAIAMAAPGIKRDDPDYYAALLVNHILGGGSFTSRLYQEVREKRGLAYSVYSGLYPLQFGGVVIARSGTANESVAETVRIIREEWQRMGKDGPTAEELRDAKTYINGSFPLRFTSSGAVANLLVGIQIHDLGRDYLDRRGQLIDSVSLDDARRVARRLLDVGGLTTVVVGQPVGLESTPDSGS